jgi:hypothetical protein
LSSPKRSDDLWNLTKKENVMKKFLYLGWIIILISLTSNSVAFARVDDQATGQYPVEIHNRTGDTVTLNLVGRDFYGVYRLTISAGKDQTFTIHAGNYDQNTFACGSSAAGTLKINRRLKLVFTPCAGHSPNQGAPSIEKIHLDDSPSGIAWAYQYNPTTQAASAQSQGVGSTGPCQLNALGDATIYNRPSTAADVFSTQPAGFTINFSARTSTGWLGFDPGVAQAANIGSFRLRWIAPGTATTTGSCASLPVVWGPPPGICFDMPMQDVNVHASPDTSATVVARLHVGEFAAIDGLSPDGNWAKVDLGPGNTGSSSAGWLERSSLNMNGPCGSLPTVTP